MFKMFLKKKILNCLILITQLTIQFANIACDKMGHVFCWFCVWMRVFVLQDKAGPCKDIYPYLIQELSPTLTELGISTPEELGIDKL